MDEHPVSHRVGTAGNAEAAALRTAGGPTPAGQIPVGRGCAPRPDTASTPPPAAAPRAGGTRLHALDALRAGALLLGIVLHALLPFVPGVPWMVVDRSSSPIAAVGVAAIHLFRMALFLFIAGYFARMSLGRKGVRGFVRDRSLRILLPLFAFWPFAVLPLGIVAGAWMTAHGTPLPAAPPSGFTPGQLWFLWVLVECYAVVLGVRAVARRLAPEVAERWADRLAAVVSGPWSVPLLAVPYVAALLWQGGTYVGVAEPTSLVPDPSGLLAYLGAFVAGWFVSRGGADALARFSSRWGAWAVVALAASTGAIWLSGRLDGPVSRVTCAVAAGLAAWSWVCGLLGLCLQFLTAERPAVRYLADASFWMYLLHLPLLVGAEAPLTDVAWPIPAKLGLALVAVSVVLLLTYDVLVRPTWIGAWLNGRRRPRALVRPRTTMHCG